MRALQVQENDPDYLEPQCFKTYVREWGKLFLEMYYDDDITRIAVISPTSDFANVTFANVFGRLANAMSRLANVLLVTSPTQNI